MKKKQNESWWYLIMMAVLLSLSLTVLFGCLMCHLYLIGLIPLTATVLFSIAAYKGLKRKMNSVYDDQYGLTRLERYK